MPLTTQTIEHEHQGTTLHGFLAAPEGAAAPRPAVIILHAWAGRGELECEKARKLAELGYVGFAADLYGGAKLGSSKEENAQLMQPFLEDRAFLASRLHAIVETVKGLDAVDADRVAAMGFCFGGLCALDVARSGADVRGVISFHGLFTPPEGAAKEKITAKVLALHGNNDPMVPVDHVIALENELTAAGVDWQIHVYGGTMHAFTNPSANDPSFGTVYHPDADRRSWKAMVNFLEELFEK